MAVTEKTKSALELVGRSVVSPGKPAHLSAAQSIGDEIAQGDLYLQIVADVPDGYVEVAAPTDQDRQLVPESGQGSHHRLRSFDGVRLFRRTDWGKSPTDLRGPCLIFDAPGAIVHEPGHDKPHGTVFIDSPMTVLCHYQRNLNAEQQERRAID